MTSSVVSTPTPSPRGSLPQAMWQRFVCCYFLLYSFPQPFQLVRERPADRTARQAPGRLNVAG